MGAWPLRVPFAYATKSWNFTRIFKSVLRVDIIELKKYILNKLFFCAQYKKRRT